LHHYAGRDEGHHITIYKNTLSRETRCRTHKGDRPPWVARLEDHPGWQSGRNQLDSHRPRSGIHGPPTVLIYHCHSWLRSTATDRPAHFNAVVFPPTEDLMPSSKSCGPRSSRTEDHQVVLGRPTGLLQWAGGLSAATCAIWIYVLLTYLLTNWASPTNFCVSTAFSLAYTV